MHLEQLKQLAEESWEGCDGCTEQDKNFWAKGFLSGHCTATLDSVEFLQWLEDNHWYRYKDGTWYTTAERPYVKGSSRKYYTKEELIGIFSTKSLNS